MRSFIRLCIAVGISQIAGVIGSLFTAPAIAEWYIELTKPALSPPNWVFGPVWITLYTLMGVAAFWVWQQGLHHRQVRVALSLFLVQLGLNTAWSLIFFGLKEPGLALIEITILWLAIVATSAAFAKVSRLAAWLLLPYLAWVSFAAYLNYGIATLN